jgi:hypothetical protein
MNTKRTLKWGLVTAAATCAVVAAEPGCELLVDFDRSKIPSGDGGEMDGTMGDAPVETGGDAPSEMSMGDAPDAPPADAPPETTTTEGGMDAPPEAAPEAGMDGGAEAEAASAAMLTINPTTATFLPTGADGSSSMSQTFTVTNTGGSASGTPSGALVGTNPSAFVIGMNTCMAAIPSMMTCTIAVTFMPADAGTLTATLQVTASPGGTVTASLTGTGN